MKTLQKVPLYASFAGELLALFAMKPVDSGSIDITGVPNPTLLSCTKHRADQRRQRSIEEAARCVTGGNTNLARTHAPLYTWIYDKSFFKASQKFFSWTV